MALQLTYGFELRYLILSRCRGNVQEQAVIRLIEKTISFVVLIISKFMTLKSLFESKGQLRIFLETSSTRRSNISYYAQCL